KGLSAYADHGTFSFAVTVNDQPQEQKTDLGLAFERPNKLTLQTEGVRVASDVTTIVSSNAALKKYMKQKAPDQITLATILTGPIGAMISGSPVQMPMLVL